MRGATARRLCSKIDLDGNPSPYYPKFRPRRLVMPVDPSDVHASRRQGNQIRELYNKQKRLKRSVERRGALTLSTVPTERTVGDAFRQMLELCEKERLFDASTSLTPPYLQPLEQMIQRVKPLSAPGASHALAYVPLHERGNTDAVQCSATPQSSALAVRRVDQVWELLDSTPLNSPPHGALALRGKAVVELTISSMAYATYPRLRSKHLQQLLHQTCGLLPCGRVALRLGFAGLTGTESEVGLWRELNTLTERLQHARKQATVHLQRVEQGVMQQRRWYWRAVLRSASGRLKLFPVTREDIQPRMEWIRHSLYVFIAFLETAAQAGEPGIDVKVLIGKLFCPQLAVFVQSRKVFSDAEALLSSEALSPEQREDLKRELACAKRLTDDEKEVHDARMHPLNSRADAVRAQFESSGGAHATQALKDDLFAEYQVRRHAHQAPPLLLHSLQSGNSLKEAQIVLKYAPHVAPELKGQPIDVDQVVRRVVEVHDTNNYASLHNKQQFRQVEYSLCNLYCGHYCVGKGKGEHLMEAMQEAGQDMLNNYYTASHSEALSGTAAKRSSQTTTASPSAKSGNGVRMNTPRVEEEVSF